MFPTIRTLVYRLRPGANPLTLHSTGFKSTPLPETRGPDFEATFPYLTRTDPGRRAQVELAIIDPVLSMRCRAGKTGL